MFSKMKAMGEGCGHGEKEQGLVFAEMAEVSALFGRAGCVRCGCEVVGVGTAAVPGRVGAFVYFSRFKNREEK
jgi:hypothetical protein